MASKSRPVITRFAPSPTGFLHIGGARTALFNWLFTRHHEGIFRLRIEDTDRARSTPAAVEAIIDGLQWLGIDWDEETVYQSVGAERHAQVAWDLLQAGKAYQCFCTPEELAEMRARAKAEGRSKLYDGRWRDRDPADAPPGVDPVVRLKMPLEGETVIEDAVQGKVSVANSQLDDMVLLRADGSPVYMLSVVADDHDMGITHVIRGDDHFTNAFRQTQLFRAMEWQEPVFAHIPLIHGPDGAKLSKRHGALGVGAYREMGYLPQALVNYLMRLGWSHGDDEVISMSDAIAWFDLPGVNKAPARFDYEKLNNLNAHYLREMEDRELASMLRPLIAEKLGRDMTDEEKTRLSSGLPGLKPRAKTLLELSENAFFYFCPRPIPVDEKARKLLAGDGPAHLRDLTRELETIVSWDESTLETAVREFAESAGIKLGKIAQPLRAALTGSNASPGIFEVMAILGREETLARIGDQVQG